ncbi:hypothetical protein [Ochrobactrum sp. Marseille-Q0166]|uniref:hypothetical protein n=1 Tax=Ochrobactrum sp. Marseille-Q0166 TaxID=2761105 RepID=UPI001655E40B|nr:hypothetical protein [Ochrobactrum sp. Marseille-Q0166]MBC8719923.1 hypothetical protein [Ochrobactrum sp. Marseille-Q0166]
MAISRQVNIQLKEWHIPAIARNVSVRVAEIGILSNAVKTVKLLSCHFVIERLVAVFALDYAL